MPTTVYGGEKIDWDDETNPCFYIDLESNDSQALKIQENASQSSYSILVESNGGTDRLGVLGSATTVDMIEIVSIVTTANIIDLGAASLTTGVALDISDLNAVTTGTGIKLYSNSSDTGTRILLDIKQDHASASGANCVTVTQDSAAIAVQVTTTATGNQQALVITSSATTATSGVIGITAAGVTTGSAIKITLAGLTTGSGINLTGVGAAVQAINFTAGSGCTAAPQTNAAIGFIKVGVAGTDQWIPYYNAT